MSELPEDLRRRLAAVFGEVLPEVTSDEAELRPRPRPDDELLENRPPHYDR